MKHRACRPPSADDADRRNLDLKPSRRDSLPPLSGDGGDSESGIRAGAGSNRAAFVPEKGGSLPSHPRRSRRPGGSGHMGRNHKGGNENRRSRGGKRGWRSCCRQKAAPHTARGAELSQWRECESGSCLWTPLQGASGWRRASMKAATLAASRTPPPSGSEGVVLGPARQSDGVEQIKLAVSEVRLGGRGPSFILVRPI